MNQKGVSITAVVFIIVILSFMGVIFVSLLTTGVEESALEYDSARALYIAEGRAEAAIAHLKQNPASNWLWNDGYLNRSLGDGQADVEVLQYETRNHTAGVTPACETSFSPLFEVAVENPARTIYAILTWDPLLNTNTNLDLKLYSDGTCTTEIANVLKTVLSNAVFIRYRITAAGTYSVKVLNNIGEPPVKPYNLSISHPDDSGFTSSSWRSVISLGKMNNARREVFTAFKK